MNNMRLKDRVALVTGGSRGIGRGIVKAFAAEGAKVAFVYLGSQAAAEALVQEVTQAGGTIKALQADVTKIEDAQRCVDEVQKTWGKLDILVNNAGIIRDDLFVRLEPDDWNKVLQTNLGGTYNFCRAVAYTMMKQRKGRIINVSSVAAEHTNPGQTNYAASKGAINSFTRALAVELASRNVTVNAIAPGFHRNRNDRGGPQQGRGPHQEDDSHAPPGMPEDIAKRGRVPGQRRKQLYHRAGADRGRRAELGGRGRVVCTIARWCSGQRARKGPGNRQA